MLPKALMIAELTPEFWDWAELARPEARKQLRYRCTKSCEIVGKSLRAGESFDAIGLPRKHRVALRFPGVSGLIGEFDRHVDDDTAMMIMDVELAEKLFAEAFASYVPPPDIDKDRVCIVWGASMVGQWWMALLSQPTSIWFTQVPLEPSSSPPLSIYPRERHARVQLEMQIGTVPELVEKFRTELTRCFEVAHSKKEDGSYGVNPMAGEASLRKQTEELERHGFNRQVGGPELVVNPKVFEARQQCRDQLGKFEPRQPVLVRDLLMRLVATYADRAANENGGLQCPTDDPVVVQRLIDALTILRDDSYGCRGIPKPS